MFFISSTHDVWQSRTTFFFGLIAATLGLGNVWRTAGLAAEHGGGVFWIIYTLLMVLIAVPIVLSEAVVGRAASGGVANAVEVFAQRSGTPRRWGGLGLFAAASALLAAVSLLLTSGWVIAVGFDLAKGEFAAVSLLQVGNYFQALDANHGRTLGLSLSVLAGLIAVLMIGVKRGLGVFVWLVSLLVFALVFVLVYHSLLAGDVAAAGTYLFKTDANAVTWKTFLYALMQAMTTLCLGLGVVSTYATYASKEVPLGRVMLAICVFDVGFGVLAGVIAYPLIFAQDITPAGGLSLLFIALPKAYGNIVQGDLMGGLYYLMTLLVISGTVIALLQVVVTLIMQRTRLSRFVAAPLVGLCVAGLLWAIYEWIESQTGYSAWLAVALSDRLLSTILLPLVALGFALLVGWQANTVGLVRALDRESHTFIRLWMGLLKYLVPLASLILLSLGWLAYF